MEKDNDNGAVFHQDASGEESSSANLHNENLSSHHNILVEMTLDEKGKEHDELTEHNDMPPPSLPPQSDQDEHPVDDKILLQEPSQQQQQQGGPNQQEQELQGRIERRFEDVSMAPLTKIEGNEGYNENDAQDHTQNMVGKAAVEEATEEARKEPMYKPDEQEPAATASAKKSLKASPIAPEAIATNTNNSETANANVNVKATTNQSTTTAIIASTAKTTTMAATTTSKKAPKRSRAKPGFGLRTSRTTIVETGQKRRSCICTNSKQCNELMTKWAKVSPPDYHCKYHEYYHVVFSRLQLLLTVIFSFSLHSLVKKLRHCKDVQLPKEHNPVPSTEQLSIEAEFHHTAGLAMGKTNGVTINGSGESSVIPGNNNIHLHNNNNPNMSDTDTYKNGFRYATLRNIQSKNPLPKDERVALCHYHPEVRPYLFWPKNTPSAQKYAIPVSLALKLGYDIIATKCQGFNTEKYCYAVPTYSFEDAKAEIGSVEEVFYDRVRQIKSNPTQFVRDLRQSEEELKEVHKLRRRNAELLRRLDDRRRSIKRLRSVLKVQRQATKEAQQQLAVQAASTNAQAHAASNNNTVHQQYQQHTYQTTTAYHQQQQMVDPSQHQQQAAPIPQPLGPQNHNTFYQPPPPTQEQQAIGIVVGGINQNSEQQHQQHEQQHHWTYTPYNANAIGGPSGSENEQQHSQQQVQPSPVHPYDPTQQQQQPVPSPMDDHNNPGNSFTYAQQLEAAMAAAVAAGFKDDQDGVVAVDDDHHQHHHDHGPPDLVGDVVDLDDLDHHDGFGGDHGDDDDLEDDEWSDTEQYRQSAAGAGSQSQQRPKKWPRKTVVLPPVSSEVEDNPKKTKRNNKSKARNNKKKAKTIKAITMKTEKSDSASGFMVQRDHLLSSLDKNHAFPKQISKT